MVDAAARDRWVAGPEISQVPTDFYRVRADRAETGSRDEGQARYVGRLSVVCGNQKRRVQPLLEAGEGISDTVPMQGLLSLAIVQCSRLQPC